MNQYRKINNIFGWFCFLFASTVYILTLEPTGSFWDCGEFIATAFKLQVGHPPGAPFFLMLGRVFSLFAGDDLSKVPIMVNLLSALASAFTILFLFWTITHLARKILVKKEDEYTTGNIISIIGSGLVGALAFTFADSFWFSAVEGEVYATSSFFTAIVFWAILKWENSAYEKHSTKWIILIAYLMGLSIGVHLLNLLAIPALVFVYYFKKYPVSKKGIITTSLVAMIILGAIQYGVIPGIISLAAKFDLFFVNMLGLSFGSGIIVYGLLILGGVIYGLYYTTKRNKPLWNTVILCFTFILIGYSTYAQIVIRSSVNTPMDENNPENIFNLLSYLNREQYGDRPLLHGQYYTAKLIDQKEGAMNYVQGKDRYEEAGKKIIPVYDPRHSTIFPRMYSTQSIHVKAYKEWGEVKGDKKPTFAQNLKFFFSYQLGHMYWRYFMWNFAGRQNDIQGHGGISDGNWISGIPAIDSIRLGPQDKLPESMTNNKGMNKFYFLPFLLGLAGLFYHFKQHKKDAVVVLLLFFFTGIAINIYLNPTPYQPRERDYAYVGSFYTYAIWIGLGVLGLIDFMRRKLPQTLSAITATLLCLAIAPGLMAKDGWDDHDRSHRKTSRDFAYDYLNTCAPNAILFTNGDNDTFPLWYAQEVEGIRTDVRVVNLSLLNTDWYIDQMKRKAYESDPVPISLSSDKYMQGNRDYVPFYDRNINEYVDLKEIIDFVGSDDPQVKARTQGGEYLNYYPAKKFRLPVDSATVVKNGTVSQKLINQILPAVEWEIDKNYLMKADLMILDILATNKWERPIYFAITVGSESYLNLEDYFQLEGLAYRLVPVRNQQNRDGQTGRVETGIMYQNLMNKFLWGGMDSHKIYMDENNIRMTMNFRNNFARLAESLLNENKKDSATKVLDKCLKVMPEENVPFNVFVIRIAEMYYRINENNTANDSLQQPGMELNKNQEEIKKANALVKRLSEIYEDDLNYYFSLNGTKYARFVEKDMQQGVMVIQELARMTREAKQTDLANELDKKLKDVYAKVGMSADR